MWCWSQDRGLYS